MKFILSIFLSLTGLQLYACNNIKLEQPGDSSFATTNTNTMKLKVTIGTHSFSATLQDNEAVNALRKILPLEMQMTELNGNEKYYNLPDDLPEKSSKPGVIKAGDLMLYGANTLVLFYKSFSTSYGYTKIGHIDDSAGLAAALGSGNVKVKWELE